jgi:hypothetical protein
MRSIEREGNLTPRFNGAMAMDYIAIIHKEPDSDFGVSFPIFPAASRQAAR